MTMLRDYFEVDGESGVVSVSASLENDDIELYTVRMMSDGSGVLLGCNVYAYSSNTSLPFSSSQLRIVAADNGTPSRSATALVSVTVIRNFFAPRWNRPSYTSSILETQAPGVVFETVEAEDQDREVGWVILASNSLMQLQGVCRLSVCLLIIHNLQKKASSKFDRHLICFGLFFCL